MVEMRSRRRSLGWLGATLLLVSASSLMAQTAPPPLLVGVAVDETGMNPGDLERGRELILDLLTRLPAGSQMSIASFSGDKRIVLPPTTDRRLITASLDAFKAGTTGVALPDGLFDMVEYLGGRDSAARVLLLFSAGRVRDGDLQFEDPLNAATGKSIPIFTLALGQGDGKLLRRIAKITGGEYVRLEVADAVMLAQAMTRSSEPAKGGDSTGAPPSSTPAPDPAEPRPSASLLGAAALFFWVGGLLMLGIVILLIRRLNRHAHAEVPAHKVPVAGGLQDPSSPRMETRPATRSTMASRPEPAKPSEDDDVIVERTLVVDTNPTLRALSGPGAGKNFALSPFGPTSIGRSRRNDIVVPEDAASAQHCRIDREGDSYVLHDLGATNGTFVNGARTERAVLKHGDRLKVGETIFTVGLFGDRS
jgi:hypothetical protein